MERPFPIEDLVDRIGNRYAIVVAVAKRARQLKSGAKPLVEIESKNPTTIALHEIAAGLVKILEYQPDKPVAVEPRQQAADLLSAVVSELGEDQEDLDEELEQAVEADHDAASEDGEDEQAEDSKDDDEQDDEDE